MNEHEPHAETREAQTPETPDWRRLEVASNRFFERIADGTAMALAEKTEIDTNTARMIAHVLGRAYGPASHLAEFGRTGEGSYLDMRDEYLTLYNDQHADPVIKEYIDWLGTYLVQRENIGSGRERLNPNIPRQLDSILVATGIEFDGEPSTIHVPATIRGPYIDALRDQLTDLHGTDREALYAFLSLPDVDASSPNLTESFHESFVGTFATVEDAIAAVIELDEREKEIDEFATGQGFVIDQLTPDYEVLLEEARQAYDVIQRRGRVHVFNK
jgi:hypothetical protein